MEKIIEAWRFKNSFIWRAKIVLSLLGLPAILFHEFCHIVFIFLFFQEFKSLTCNKWFDLDIETGCLSNYSFTVWGYRSESRIGKMAGFFIPIAPAFGILGLLYCNLYFLIPILIFFRQFWVSASDIRAAKEALLKLQTR